MAPGQVSSSDQGYGSTPQYRYSSPLKALVIYKSTSGKKSRTFLGPAPMSRLSVRKRYCVVANRRTCLPVDFIPNEKDHSFRAKSVRLGSPQKNVSSQE
ncbi:hypothetical protein SKAU_G00182020 [Synaphobranchus kaupii]|uniref:Uncharacterized protein n=1 Tax=Synaphobranchus kaupii TaxID=118154 RepID=A0A9Q1FC95_SYNKA|nr:hypothetical protein SKAU_G00182020 [Synaphobranchus kaupii]